MLFFIHVMLLLNLGFRATVTSTSTRTQREIKKPKLEEPFTLNCTYNCSSGFTRGQWTWEETPECSECDWKSNDSKSGVMCSTILYTPHLILQQTRYNYTCISEENDRPGLPRKTELVVTLQVQDEPDDDPVTSPEGQGSSLRVKMYRGQVELEEVLTSLSSIEAMAGTSLMLYCVVPDNKHCEGQWIREGNSIPWLKNDSVVQWSQITVEDGGRYRCQAKETCSRQAITVEIEVIASNGFIWAKVFAAVAVAAMFVLINLCYRRRCKTRTMDTDGSLSHDRGASRNAVALRPVPQDTQTEHEVPYADIVISMRGSSNPDISGTFDHPSKHHRPRWRDEARAGLQHVSSDRLHIHSKEVTRKLSTTSEYAVITYSCEALS